MRCQITDEDDIVWVEDPVNSDRDEAMMSRTQPRIAVEHRADGWPQTETVRSEPSLARCCAA
jgi:hypothetical protein